MDGQDGLLYLEDLFVGRRFVSGEVTLTAEAIKAFAAEYDPQPFHIDEAAAEATFFRGLAASGWHVAAASMRLIVSSTPIAGGLIGAGCEVEWPRPTRPGEVLHVESEVLEIIPSRSRPDRAIVRVRNETKTAAGEVVQVMTAKIVVHRRPAA